MMYRVIFSILLFASVLLLPFWVTAVLGLVGMIYFRLYLEAVVVFFISDLLFAVPLSRYGGSVYVTFSVAVITFLIIEILKPWLSSKNKGIF